MIIDHRTYNIVPRMMGEYLKVFEEFAMPVQRRHLGEPILFTVTEVGQQDQVIHLWAYKDYADLEARRAARNADPEWKIYMEKSRPLVLSQETKLIRPTAFSPIK